jgi:hypothetical protein
VIGRHVSPKLLHGGVAGFVGGEITKVDFGQTTGGGGFGKFIV